MTLTAEEKPLVIQWLREYPAGVPSDAWGYGPLLALSKPRESLSRETKMRYG